MAMGDGLMRLRHVEVTIKDLVDLVKATPDAAQLVPPLIHPLSELQSTIILSSGR